MLTCQQSVFKRYHSDKHFSQFLPTKWRQKSTGIDMEQHYVTVSIRGNAAVPITAQLSLERVPHTVLSGAISRPPDWRHQQYLRAFCRHRIPRRHQTAAIHLHSVDALSRNQRRRNADQHEVDKHIASRQ